VAEAGRCRQGRHQQGEGVRHHPDLLRLQLDRARQHGPGAQEKIKQAFLALDPANPEHKAILDLQAASRFIETKPENYKGTEQAAREAGLLK
jgi:hypothetical protein